MGSILFYDPYNDKRLTLLYNIYSCMQKQKGRYGLKNWWSGSATLGEVILLKFIHVGWVKDE